MIQMRDFRGILKYTKLWGRAWQMTGIERLIRICAPDQGDRRYHAALLRKRAAGNDIRCMVLLVRNGAVQSGQESFWQSMRISDDQRSRNFYWAVPALPKNGQTVMTMFGVLYRTEIMVDFRGCKNTSPKGETEYEDKKEKPFYWSHLAPAMIVVMMMSANRTWLQIPADGQRHTCAAGRILSKTPAVVPWWQEDNGRHFTKVTVAKGIDAGNKEDGIAECHYFPVMDNKAAI